MPKTPHLQLATARDVPIIAAMSRELIETGLGWSWTRARVGRALAAADTNVLVARLARRVVGFGVMARSSVADEEAFLGGCAS
jgi:ribosomal-protein-alanine N-acetyltransferase